MPLIGHCNCSGITITLADPPQGQHSTVYCHCTTCRRQSGASGTYVVVVDESLVTIDDPNNLSKTWRDTLTDSGAILNRQFCGQCGCPLTGHSPKYAGKIIVKMGLFDTIPPPMAEIYCKNRQDWEPPFAKALGIPGTEAGRGK